MDARDKLLRDFEALTTQIADLERSLTEARGRQDQLRRAIRMALKSSRDGGDDADNGETSAAAMETVEAVRKQELPVDATKLAELLGVEQSVARTRLQRAAGLGLLRRVKRGCYEAIPPAE